MLLSSILKHLPVQNGPEKDMLITYVSNDIRKLSPHTLVFHLNRKTEPDIEKLFRLKNCFIITDRPLLLSMTKVKHAFFFVPDVLEAYERFIRFYRSQFNIPVIAVTGTCGKTTTKEMISQALKQSSPVASTVLSKNAMRFSHDYLLSIDNHTQYAVFETAVTSPGHIIENAAYFKPDIGVITNIGTDHLNECKTADLYARTKGEMLAALRYNGTLVINYDDENIRKIDLSPLKGKIVSFGLQKGADFRADDIEFLSEGMKFTVSYKKETIPAYIPGCGVHNVYNALAAAAVLHLLGMSLEEAVGRLQAYQPIKAHLELIRGIRGSTLIDDTWSSNPTSLKAALEVLKVKGKTTIAVLGAIAYLGNHEQAECDKMGKMLVDKNVDYLVVTDRFSKAIGKAAEKYGMKTENIMVCKGSEETEACLRKLLNKDTAVLFKISMFDKSFAKIIRQLSKREV